MFNSPMIYPADYKYYNQFIYHASISATICVSIFLSIHIHPYIQLSLYYLIKTHSFLLLLNYLITETHIKI